MGKRVGKPVARLSLRILARLGLLRFAYRVYERVEARRHRDDAAVAGDLPLPPPWLRVRVAGSGDAEWFLEGGKLAVETIASAAGRAGRTLEDFESILDFGCGSGRVIRHLSHLPGQIVGSDIDRPAIEWSRRNLPFARFLVNDIAPPFDLEDSTIDLAYAFSVITHLPVALQHEWMAELRRVLRPGGLLLLSAHGDHYLPRLTPPESAQFRSGQVVVRFDEVAGTNLCTTFHPRGFVERSLARDFEVVFFEAEGALGNPRQDVYLLRR